MTAEVMVSVAVVGCGAWGGNLVRNFAGLGALAAVCDPDAAAADAAARRFSVPAASWDDILQNPALTAVVIAAPAAMHARLAAAALAAGKHVFVEKPLALEEADAAALVRRSEAAGRVLMVGHLLQHHPAFIRLKELVHGGTLGQIRHVFSSRLNLGKIRREENVLWSFAPHDVSMILSLIGREPTRVSAVGAAHLNRDVADIVNIDLSFPGGEEAHISVSWLHPFKEQKLTVVGDRGMAVFDDGLGWADKLRLYPHRIDWINGAPVPTRAEAQAVALEPAEPLELECAHFLDCIRAGASPRTDGREGLAVLRTLQAAQRALDRAGQAAPTGGVEGAGAKQAPARIDPGAGVHDTASIHETAYVDRGARIGANVRIWHFSHILSGVVIGPDCNIGQNVMIGPNVAVGAGCKIQNNVSLYPGVTLEDGVFCGPSCVFTNVLNPRAEVERKNEFRPTLARRGATIGANATVVCGHTLGEYCFIAAGAVVTKDVPAFALMVGAPARRAGWVSHACEILGEDLVCPRSGRRYRQTAPDLLEEIIP